MNFTTALELLGMLLIIAAMAIAAATAVPSEWAIPTGLASAGIGALAASTLIEWSVARNRRRRS